VRQSITVEGFGHGNNPVPAASLLQGLLVSGAIFGMDPATMRVASGLERQCELMLQHAERILQAAGCDWGGVLKMNFFIAPEVPRERVNQHWLRLFPDAASRPARHVLVNDKLPPGTLIQCDLMALAPR
jgi:2-iminobutanoate/2-iminopropanoate deaminase